MPIDYKTLLKAIQNQKCALVLGPNASLLPDGRTTFAAAIALKIKTMQPPLTTVQYYPGDDLYHIPEPSDRTRVCEVILEEANLALSDLQAPGFYTAHYDQLTDLPFRLVLSLSPDQFLLHWMRKRRHLDAQFACFRLNEATEDIQKATITRDKPLVFNLFGEVSKPESLILTQEDFYKYLHQVFTNPKKLEGLRAVMADIDYLLFVGFPLDRWYVKLLMLLMDVNSKSRYIAYATHPKRDDLLLAQPFQPGSPELIELEDFCGKHFKIVAFADDNFLAFTHALHDAALAAAVLPNPLITLRPTAAVATPVVPAPATPRSVAISYAADEQSIAIADKIAQAFTDKGYTVLSEKISLGYRGNVQEFIQKMGAGKAVVAILSDKFLKEKKCMTVALAMEAQQQLADRIFPIVLADARIYDAVGLAQYLNYWDIEKEKINQALKAMPDISYTNSITQELNLCSEIRRFSDGFVSVVNNMNVLTPDLHLGENFTTLFHAVEARFKKDP